MDLRQVLPLVLAAAAALIVLRVLMGLVRASAKFLVWGVLLAAVVGGGFLWYQGQRTTRLEPPTLQIPGP